MTVYAVQMDTPDGANPFKVGYADDVRQRISGIASMLPYPTTVLGCVEGSWGVEDRFHWILRAHKLRGEWFAGVGAHAAVLHEIVSRGHSKKCVCHDCRPPIQRPPADRADRLTGAQRKMLLRVLAGEYMPRGRGTRRSRDILLEKGMLVVNLDGSLVALYDPRSGWL